MLHTNDRSWWRPDTGVVPLVDLTVADLLGEAAEAAPQHEAVVFSAYDDPELTVRWTYGDLWERAEALARALISRRVEPGQSVALWAPNVPNWLVAEFAVAIAGAVLVPLNPTYRADEVAYALAESEAVGCLLVPAYSRFDLWQELCEVRAGLPQLAWVASLVGAAPGLPSYAEFVAAADGASSTDVAARMATARAEDPVQIQFTSGTTGRPKGAVLTHHNIVNNARQSVALWRLTDADRWCNPLPLFHTAGCGMVALGAVAARATHLPLVRFEPDRVLRTIDRERCTVLETVPTILSSLVERQRREPVEVASLRLIGTSGAPTPEWLGTAVTQEWGTPLRVLYGSTEVSPTVSATALDAAGTDGWTTVGRPLPWTEMRVVDPVTREVIPLGVPGEIEVRGYQVMRGYHRRPEATAEAIDQEGWFHTGDLGTLDGSGILRIVGRLKDVIIRGGENLYPAEIEDLIRGYPGVGEVAVIGVPDDFFGEEACAVISPAEGADVDGNQLRLWMRQRTTHQKVPRYVTVMPVLPQTASGKVQKYRLRDEVIRRINFGASPEHGIRGGAGDP